MLCAAFAEGLVRRTRLAHSHKGLSQRNQALTKGTRGEALFVREKGGSTIGFGVVPIDANDCGLWTQEKFLGLFVSNHVFEALHLTGLTA